MTRTKDGDIIIHKETWETMLGDEYYHEIAEAIEDLESHYDAMAEGGRLSLDKYLKQRRENV